MYRKTGPRASEFLEGGQAGVVGVPGRTLATRPSEAVISSPVYRARLSINPRWSRIHSGAPSRASSRPGHMGWRRTGSAGLDCYVLKEYGSVRAGGGRP